MAWLEGSRAAGLLSEEEHRPDGAPHGAQLTRCCHPPGAKLAPRERRAGLQPGVLAGIHVYLHGAFSEPSKPEVQAGCRAAGATLLSRSELVPP